MTQLYCLKQEQTLNIPIDQAWQFFSNPYNLGEITPPQMGFKITNEANALSYEGQIISYQIGILPFITTTWVTEVKGLQLHRQFVDEQRFGPYAFWHHHHCFESLDGAVRMTDEVHYVMPFGLIGRLVHFLYVGRKLKSIFEFRRKVLAQRFGEP
ncbi:MAG: SRPBCC family protein [bacterium]|nr:SRPBCC family protein [bacterium]